MIITYFKNNMKLNFAKVESHFKKSDFYEKLLEEIQDIVFTFVISNNNNYDLLLVSGKTGQIDHPIPV
jgi:hypothetical protein